MTGKQVTLAMDSIKVEIAILEAKMKTPAYSIAAPHYAGRLEGYKHALAILEDVYHGRRV
jgi:hypothetical protein